MSWSGSTLHSHRHGEVKQSRPSRPGARAASQRASPGGTELSRGAVSRAVGGRRERACVLSVQQVCCTACWQAVQIWSDGGARARWPPRAACRRARLARWSCVVPGAARSGRAWCLKQCAGAWQRAWTVSRIHCGARVAARVVVRLALMVREARGWCGRRGTAMGRQHRACAHDTGFWALRACLRARGDVRADFTRCAWRRA